MKKYLIILLLASQIATAQSPMRSGMASVKFDPYEIDAYPEPPIRENTESTPPRKADEKKVEKKVQVRNVKNVVKSDLKNTPLPMSEHPRFIREAPIRDRYQTTYVSESPLSRLANRR